jgi:TetR/AcrR family transcriptional regulator, cholesterol catabolism regulator
MVARGEATGKRGPGRSRVPVGSVSLELIEREATRLFGERTYPVVGIRDISDAVGILPGSLYVHISSKDELLRRIVEQGIQNYLDVIEPIAVYTAPAPDRLRSAIKAYVTVLHGTLEQTKVAFDQWHYLQGESRARVVAMRLAYEKLFFDIVCDGIDAKQFRPQQHLRVAVLMTLGMLNSLSDWYLPDGPLSPAEIGELLADSALLGLGS